MQRIAQTIVSVLKKVLPILIFIIPFTMLYFLYPSSYEATWKGRTFYLFFLWLVFLEVILNWEKIQSNKLHKLKSVRTVAVIIALSLPIVYVVAANYYGLNTAIVDLAKSNDISPNVVDLMPLSMEYLVLTVLFGLIVALYYGVSDLRNFSISTLFLGTIGMIYTIDNLYPWGRFTPFQIFVPTTTMLAAGVLNLMGFSTTISPWYDATHSSLTYLTVNGSQGATASFPIAWPCSGVDSLLIYTVTILLFLKGSSISWKQRIGYFAFGAGVTYFVNALRIVTIFLIAMNGGDWSRFHDYYGPLYSISWIISYPLIIMGTRTLWSRMVGSRFRMKSNVKPSLETGIPQ